MVPDGRSRTRSWNILLICSGTKAHAKCEQALLLRSAEQIRPVSCRKAHPDREVLAAHMELARPSIKDAIYECWKRGCSKVAVAPYFLSQGRHIQQDIPSLVAEANEAHPELECIIAEPIGKCQGPI